MSGLKFQSPRLGSTATKDFSAELVLVSELYSWDLPMTLAALQHPAVAVQLLHWSSPLCHTAPDTISCQSDLLDAV